MCLPSFLKRSVDRLSGKGSRTGEEEDGEAPTARTTAAAVMTAPIAFIPAADFVKLRDSSVAVIDVRDEEREYDGHIAGSLYYPSGSFVEKMPDLLKDVRSKDTVVFHCAKSQVRGPSCARVLAKHLRDAPSAAGEKRPKVLVLERGFDGWAAAGRPVCSCKDVQCSHKP